MTDIVERLRNPDVDTMQEAQLLDEAADEIERLRAALGPFADLAELIECTSTHDYSDDETWEAPIGKLRIARRALEEK